ncbi:MAG: hypothetical protein RBT80_14780 [Candidatus Vecturithrix sp.]|jgi:asparagine synthetase B (glutamine-hydrolysing)|nr:hypothetical protein [Candidatus Vecturithrix sp.]
MNSFFGKITWTAKQNKSIFCDEHSFSNGIIEFRAERIRIFRSAEKTLYYNKNSRVLCAIIGYICNIEEIREKYELSVQTDVETVEYLYRCKGPAFSLELEGLFWIWLFDENEQKGYILQSEPGTGLPLYYTTTNATVLFSTSLKQLLLSFPQQRELDREAVKDFFHFSHVIPNESTLIKGVQKLLPGTALAIDFTRQSIQVKTHKSHEVLPSKQEAKAQLLPSIQACVKNLFYLGKQQEAALTLTAGWDTNLLLHFLKKETNAQITAVTINGGGKQNEIPATASILEHYPKVRHLTATVHYELSSLPEIVWILEGYVFQEGMFLRSELARVLAQEDLHSVFLGACGDQVLYPVPLLKKLLEKIPGGKYKMSLLRILRLCKYRYLMREGGEERAFRLKTPPHKGNQGYHLDIEFLLKMHEMMLNSFEIMGFFPLLNRKTARMAKRLGILNRKKAFYKQKIKRLLAPQITQYFKKSGSVVDTRQSFEANKAILLKILNTSFVETILTEAQRQLLIKQPSHYHLVILQVAYLYVFHELIVSGRLDAQFDQPHLDVTLTDLLTGRV